MVTQTLIGCNPETETFHLWATFSVRPPTTRCSPPRSSARLACVPATQPRGARPLKTGTDPAATASRPHRVVVSVPQADGVRKEAAAELKCHTLHVTHRPHTAAAARYRAGVYTGPTGMRWRLRVPKRGGMTSKWRRSWGGRGGGAGLRSPQNAATVEDGVPCYATEILFAVSVLSCDSWSSSVGKYALDCLEWFSHAYVVGWVTSLIYIFIYDSKQGQFCYCRPCGMKDLYV